MPFPRARAGFFARAGSRRLGRLMCAEKKSGTVFVENILRSVAMMDIPIGDEHAFDPIETLGIACRNRDVIEEAEAHTAGGAGMVSGGPNQAKCVPHCQREQSIDCG